MVRFGDDQLDQSLELIQALQQRKGDASQLLHLPGDHLTAASAGLRRKFLGEWAEGGNRQEEVEGLVTLIAEWGSQ